LNAFSSIRNNNITSPDVGGSPNFELFNGQDAIADGLAFVGNSITTAGAIIVNVNTSGGVTNSVISSNTLNAGGSNTFEVTTNSDNNSFTGNTGLSGSIISTNSTGVGNTGNPTFSGTGSSFANNV
jgi:hypothetical protein